MSEYRQNIDMDLLRQCLEDMATNTPPSQAPTDEPVADATGETVDLWEIACDLVDTHTQRPSYDPRPPSSFVPGCAAALNRALEVMNCEARYTAEDGGLQVNAQRGDERIRARVFADAVIHAVDSHHGEVLGLAAAAKEVYERLCEECATYPAQEATTEGDDQTILERLHDIELDIWHEINNQGRRQTAEAARARLREAIWWWTEYEAATEESEACGS